MHYIKKSILTLMEAFILFCLTCYISKIQFAYKIPEHLYSYLLLGMLCIVVSFKIFLARLGRYWILNHSLHKVDCMTGEEFELFLKAHFERLGCTATTTSRSGDYGADLILNYKGRTIAVQAKRHNSTIGVKAVQEVLGSMAYYETDIGLVVTNSTYSKNAEELALANDILLWDRDVLIRMMNKENMSGYLSEFL